MNHIAHHALTDTEVAGDSTLGLSEALQAIGYFESIHVQNVTGGRSKE